MSGRTLTSTCSIARGMPRDGRWSRGRNSKRIWRPTIGNCAVRRGTRPGTVLSSRLRASQSRDCRLDRLPGPSADQPHGPDPFGGGLYARLGSPLCLLASHRRQHPGPRVRRSKRTEWLPVAPASRRRAGTLGQNAFRDSPGLLGHLQERGYAFVRVDELLTPSLRRPMPPSIFAPTRWAIFLTCRSWASRCPPSRWQSGFLWSKRRADGWSSKDARTPCLGRWGKFTQVAELDFSAFERPGRYRLRLGESQSLPFTLGADVFRPLPDVLLEFMRQQRCGYNPWLDADATPSTAARPTALADGTPIDARGGWHDAADLLKYLLTSSNATAQLLLAWQLQPCRRTAIAAPFFADRVNDVGPAGCQRHAGRAGRGTMGTRVDAQAASGPRTSCITRWPTTATTAGWRLPQNERPTTAGEKAAPGSCILPTAGRRASAIPERVDRRGEPGGTLCRGDGAGLSDLEGRSAAGGRSPGAACRRARKSTGSGRRRKACSRATPTGRRIATRRRPGPTTWSGARPSCFARRASALSRRRETYARLAGVGIVDGPRADAGTTSSIPS